MRTKADSADYSEFIRSRPNQVTIPFSHTPQGQGREFNPLNGVNIWPTSSTGLSPCSKKIKSAPVIRPGR